MHVSRSVSYLPRIVDDQLAEALATAGAVVLEGPKACGKTDTALRSASSSVPFDVDPTSRETVSIDPFLVLEGATPRLLDEWQRAPEVWDAVRRAVARGDARGVGRLAGQHDLFLALDFRHHREQRLRLGVLRRQRQPALEWWINRRHLGHPLHGWHLHQLHAFSRRRQPHRERGRSAPDITAEPRRLQLGLLE